MRTWIITRNCNYNCHFCSQKYQSRNTTEEECIKIIDFFNYSSNDVEWINVFGGEPTLYPYLFLVFENLKYKKILLTTNLSCSKEYLEELVKIRTFQVLASYHSEFADEEKFYKNIEFLQEKNIKTQINMTFERIDKRYIESNYFKIYKKISSDFPNISFALNAFDHIQLNEEIFDIFNKVKSFYNYRSNEYIKTKKKDLKYNNCYKENLCVNHNGEVFICVSDANRTNSFPLYNILKNDWKKIHTKLKNIDLVCPGRWCCK